MATHPLELVHLDYLCLDPGKGLEENVLVVTDHFTQDTQAYVTQTTQTTAKTLWDNFIVNYGLPKKILSDWGRNFESQLVADLCMLMGTQKLWTSPYHSQTNSQHEKFNSTLIDMLGTLPPEKKSEWKNHIGALIHAYNCTQNSATGLSPYYLMYPNLPLYMVCPRDGEGHSWTLHRNYLLPISSNLEQNEKDAPMAGVGNTNTSTLVPSVDSKPADVEPSGMVTSSTAGNMSQGSPDQPAPLRCGTYTTQNWLPRRYQNFGLLADTSQTGIWDAWVGLCICLHFISFFYSPTQKTRWQAWQKATTQALVYNVKWS